VFSLTAKRFPIHVSKRFSDLEVVSVAQQFPNRELQSGLEERKMFLGCGTLLSGYSNTEDGVLVPGQ